MLEVEIVGKREKSKLDILKEELDILSSVSPTADKIQSKIIISNKKVGPIKFKTKTEYIFKKGEYISLLGLCETLKKYRKYISNETYKFKKSCYGIRNNNGNKCFIDNISFEIKGDAILTIKSMVSAGYVFCYGSIILNCSDEIPIITNNEDTSTNMEAYELFKPYLFDYLGAIYNYKIFLKEIASKTYDIGEITTLKIKIPDLINNGKISIEINIGNFALINIIIEKGNIVSTVFSGDNEVNDFLREHKDELLQNIFVADEFEDLLKIIENVSIKK